MSTPMYDVPEHCPIRVNAEGQGPIGDDEPGEIVCWCGQGDACGWNRAFKEQKQSVGATLAQGIRELKVKITAQPGSGERSWQLGNNMGLSDAASFIERETS